MDFLNSIGSIVYKKTMLLGYEDFSQFDSAHNAADYNTVANWSAIGTIFDKLGFGMLGLVQRIGLWGSLLLTMMLIIGLIFWQGNQRELSKVIKNTGTIIIVFILIVNITGWVSLWQKATYISPGP